MKLTRITPIHVAIPYEHGAPKPIQTSGRERTTMDAVYVKVETDAGIVGWGEAYGFGACAVTATALARMIVPLAEGRELKEEGDGKGVTAFMFDLRRKTQSAGLNGPVSFGLSGLDIALWDIAGKIANKPLQALLKENAVALNSPIVTPAKAGVQGPLDSHVGPLARGPQKEGRGNDAEGKRNHLRKTAGKTKVPAYASMLKLGTPENLKRVLGIAGARGYRHFKLHEKTVEAVAVARDVVGPKTPLMLDCNCAFLAEEATGIAERLKPYDLAWFEEPIFPPDDYAALANLRTVGVPIAVGENLGNLNEVRRLLEAKAVDIVQPDVCKMGGVTELMKALALARAMGTAAEPHSPYYGPGLIASVHCLAALDETSDSHGGGHEVLCEYFFADLAASPCGDAAIPRDGYLAVPEGAGLGVVVDEALVERFRVR